MNGIRLSPAVVAPRVFRQFKSPDGLPYQACTICGKKCSGITACAGTYGATCLFARSFPKTKTAGGAA